MSGLISTAYAATAGGAHPQGGGAGTIIMLVVFLAFLYFLILRPQSKRAKEHRALISGLTKGDEVVTSGGILGKITNVADSFISIQISDGVEINVQKNAVSSTMPKGTIKTA